jgi:luciferase family oxidoreductase group 1
LSVLDIGPIRSNQAAPDAFASMIELARSAEQSGYRRYWLAEHHNVAGVVAGHTSVFSAAVGAHTNHIRIGGVVLLPHYSPLLVAEQAAILEACYPGRVDIGVGRSTGADWITSAVLRGGGEPRADADAAHPQALSTLVTLLQPDGAHVQLDGSDYGIRSLPNASSAPPAWVLGTSTYSARLAAEQGLPYAFGYHITGEGVRKAICTYRSLFKPSRFLAEPKVLVSAIVVVGDSDEEAQRLAKPQLMQMAAFRSGDASALQPLVEAADARSLPEHHVGQVEMFKRTWVIGTPERAAEQLMQLATSLDIDEIMINPVAGAYASDDPRRAPNREYTLTSLARALGIREA